MILFLHHKVVHLISDTINIRFLIHMLNKMK